jgi:hypothetical protein
MADPSTTLMRTFRTAAANGWTGWFAVVPAYSRTEPAALRSPVCVRRLR